MSAEAERHPPPHGGTIAGLDGVRGAAILLVILWHCAARTTFPPDQLGLLRPLVLIGWSGVDLFFALSGFLITRLLLQEEAAAGGSGSIDLRKFYLRRSLRIFPAFYLVLLANALVLRFVPMMASLRGLGQHGPVEWLALATYWSAHYYGYVIGITPPPAVGVYWSLCTEEHFYLLWPLLLVLVRSAGARRAVALGACLVLPLLRWWAAAWEAPGAIHMLSHYRLDSILWGCLAALGFRGLTSGPARERYAVFMGMAVAVAAAYGLGALGAHATRWGQSAGLSLLAILSTALIANVAGHPAGLIGRAFALLPLRGVGRLSYGMYLLHFQAIDVVAPWVLRAFPVASPAAYLVLVTAAGALTYLAAALMYYGFERHFLRLKPRYTPRRAPAAGLEPPPADAAEAISLRVT